MMMIPTSVIKFFGQPEELVTAAGAITCVLTLDDAGQDISWHETMIVVSESNVYAHYFFSSHGLESWRVHSRHGRVKVTLTDFREYLNEYSDIVELHRLWGERKRVRLGPNSAKPFWSINQKEAFVIRMSDEAFLQCFIPDPRSGVQYAAALQSFTLILPRMIELPEGFPREGSLTGPVSLPRTGFPARDP